MSRRRFDQAMERMRRSDPQSREAGFDFLREHADAYVAELIEEFRAEHDDQGLRCRLIELVAEARDASTLDFLAEQLEVPDEDVRFWAVRGLEMLDTRKAEAALDRARDDGLIS
ncbi:HEAT repeat domain-containing protein [Spirillospora sp. NPDC047279]|uniref:HEAT repeat domain-containing protein n=1 Tax=Spirillospora sp. NPDC047279 TaxID=3155478 RepID=UPI0033D67825